MREGSARESRARRYAACDNPLPTQDDPPIMRRCGTTWTSPKTLSITALILAFATAFWLNHLSSVTSTFALGVAVTYVAITISIVIRSFFAPLHPAEEDYNTMTVPHYIGCLQLIFAAIGTLWALFLQLMSLFGKSQLSGNGSKCFSSSTYFIAAPNVSSRLGNANQALLKSENPRYRRKKLTLPRHRVLG